MSVLLDKVFNDLNQLEMDQTLPEHVPSLPCKDQTIEPVAEVTLNVTKEKRPGVIQFARKRTGPQPVDRQPNVNYLSSSSSEEEGDDSESSGPASSDSDPDTHSDQESSENETSDDESEIIECSPHKRARERLVQTARKSTSPLKRKLSPLSAPSIETDIACDYGIPKLMRCKLFLT